MASKTFKKLCVICRDISTITTGDVRYLCLGAFLYSITVIFYEAELTRQWYYQNWCDAVPQNECLYFVGSIFDYAFLTSSAFHSGFTLLHMVALTSIITYIILNQIRILDLLEGGKK